MKCKFEYCIYNQSDICTLNEIKINSLGMCEDCEVADIPKEILAVYKQLRLEEIEGIWKYFEK